MNHSQYQKSLKTKSDESLLFIIKDCREALTANPNNPKANHYSDEICYCSMELSNRRRKRQLILTTPEEV